MKRKRLTIGLGIAVVLVGAVLFGVRQAWLAIYGTERLSGPRQAIPRAVLTPPPRRERPSGLALLAWTHRGRKEFRHRDPKGLVQRPNQAVGGAIPVSGNPHRHVVFARCVW